MKQTALTQLIAKLKEERLTNPVDSPLNIGLTVAIGLATELLEVEKQQIIDAANCNNPSETIYGNIGKSYYTLNFEEQ